MIVVEQRNFSVCTVDGFSIAIRETRSSMCTGSRTPVVLLRGTSHVDESDESDAFAADLARAGHICFSLGVRGFGQSDRRQATMGAARRPAPLVRSIEIARDLDAAANELRKVSGVSKVGIVQWGAPVGIVYAALWPEKVSHLVLCDMTPNLADDAPQIQPGMPECDDFNLASEADQPWAYDIATADDGQAATITKRLALQDLAPRRDPSRFPDELAMNYANHIYCKVMVIESDIGAGIEAESAAQFRNDFTRAQEIRVSRQAAAGHGGDDYRPRGGLIGSLAEFLR
jgi:pimeloyl-ACP methyl ester carboxylesterase